MLATLGSGLILLPQPEPLSWPWLPPIAASALLATSLAILWRLLVFPRRT